MNIPSRIEQDVEVLTGRRGKPGERAVRLKELQQVDQRTTALAGSVQRQIADAGIPSIRDKIESIRGFLYNTLTYVDNEVQGARDDFTTARNELQGLIDAQGVTIVDIQSNVGANAAAIVSEAAARATADTALAGQITTISASVSDNAAAITAEQLARSSQDTALAGQITTLSATVGTNTSAITAEQLARTNADTAIAADITSLQSSLGAANASITQQGQTLATLEGYAAATYVLRAKAGGAGAALEIVAADDPVSGAQSALRLSADDILLDGTVTAQHVGLESLTADRIDTRGLTVRDASGNVILSSGVPLDWSRVSGVGRPENYADRTINNTAANILGQGAFATISQITTGNASTFIESLAVGRLQLGNNSVSVSSFANTSLWLGGQGLNGGQQRVGNGGVISIPPFTTARVLISVSYQMGYITTPRGWKAEIYRTILSPYSLTKLFGRPDPISGGAMQATTDFTTIQLIDTYTNNTSSTRSYLPAGGWYGQDANIEIQRMLVSATAIFK